MMSKQPSSTSRLLAWLTLMAACTPLRDLDAAAAGDGEPSSGGLSGSQGGNDSSAGSTSRETGGASATGAGAASNKTNSGGRAAGGTSSAGASGVPATAGGTFGGSHDAGSEGGAISGESGAVSQGAEPSGGSSSSGGNDATGGKDTNGGAASAGERSSGGAPGTGGSSFAGGSSGGGASSTGGSAASTGGSGSVAPDLPEISNFPISGQIVLTENATWSVGRDNMPTDQVETPVGRFTLVKSAAAIVSIEASGGSQWIAFNSFRPKRGLPALGVCCESGDPSALGLPVMATTVDRNSFTQTHLRLVSKSSSGDIHLVWDFYLTHLTITLNRLATPFGFTYRGVPGSQLDATDELRLSDGTARNANSTWTGDLPGPAEWVYFADPALKRSLFVIRHGDDDLTESYQVADQDSAKFVFSNGQSTTLPARFSVGLIDSTTHADVAARVKFVVDATP